MVRKPATLKDVAALAQVSRATAARALNHYGYVGDATAQKVQAAAEKLGYRGNRLAQALRNGQLPIIGCILGDIQNPFFACIAHNIELLARECGHNLVIGSSEEELGQEICHLPQDCKAVLQFYKQMRVAFVPTLHSIQGRFAS